jgi:hypothetical protein
MVVAYGQQYFISVEAPSAYVPPQPGSHAMGLYSDELVAAIGVAEEAVLDAAVERRLGLEAAKIGGCSFQNRRGS